MSLISKEGNWNINVAAVSGTGHNVHAHNIKVTGLEVNIPPSPAERLPEIWKVPQRNTKFTGRSELLERIRHYFGQNDILLILHGLGGIGKTQIALEYVWQNFEAFNGVAWFDAKNLETLQYSYIELGRMLNILSGDENEDAEQLSGKVIDWLQNTKHAGWLLVYDNAPDYASISKLLPTKGGKILVTSRYSHGWNAEKIIVDVFTPNESRVYIQKILGNEFSETHVDTLVELLGRLPLALSIASHYIEMNTMNISRYLELYNQRKKDILSEKKSVNTDQILEWNEEQKPYTSVYITWDITMDKIRYVSLLATNWLNACACLSSNNIPHFLLEEFAKNRKNNPKQEIFDKTLGILKSYSMITINNEHQSASIHPLVQEVIRLKWQIEEEESNLTTVCELLVGNVPENRQLEDYAKMRKLLPHLEAFLPHLEALRKRATEVANKLLETDIDNSFETFILKLAHCHLIFMNAHKAKDLLSRVLPMMEKRYGDDHPEVAIILTNLGIIYRNLGDYKKALEILEKALAIKKGPYILDDQVEAGILTNLGNVYGQLGDYNKALEVLERAWLIYEKHYGPDDPEVAVTLINLGNAYITSGNYKKALEIYERALRIDEMHYGPDHPQVALTLTNLGNAYGNLGNYRKALEILERALRIDEMHYGPDHPQVALILTNLGNAYSELRDYKKALEIYERVLQIDEMHYGSDHPEVAFTLTNLGIAYSELRDYKKALEIYEKALQIIESHYGPGHSQVALALMNLGNAYMNLRNYIKSLEIYEKALPIIERHYGPDHPKVALMLMNLGNAYMNLRNYKKVHEVCERALRINEIHNGTDHQYTIKSRQMLSKNFS